MALSIHALPAGVLRNFPSAALTYQRGFGQVQDCPQIMFAILGGPSPVLVDTGTPDPAFVREYHGYDFERDEQEHPLATLAGLGVRPEDVEVVIHTHLHWDHCGNDALFPAARFVVQRSEVAYASDPLPPNRVAFERVGEVEPPWKAVESSFELVDGDAEVLPGISVIHLPGHTPGSQGVLVETAGGAYLIAGDTVNTYRNWEGDGTLPHLLNGSLISLPDHWRSFERIAETGATVIPSHDPLVLQRGVFD